MTKKQPDIENYQVVIAPCHVCDGGENDGGHCATCSCDVCVHCFGFGTVSAVRVISTDAVGAAFDYVLCTCGFRSDKGEWPRLDEPGAIREASE